MISIHLECERAGQNKFKKDEEVNFKNITIPARYAEMARDLPKGKICEKQAKVQI